MDRKIWEEAGYSYRHDSSYPKRCLDDLVWDDNYDLLKVGTHIIKGDEYFNEGWCNYIYDRPILTGDAVFRRLKPGLERIEMKKVVIEE